MTFPFLGYTFPARSIHGWILIQQSLSTGHATFNRSWDDYRNGFGQYNDNYWLGNEKVYQLTTSSSIWKLRVEVQSKDTGKWYSAEYAHFRLSNESTKYVLEVSGYSGDAGKRNAFASPTSSWNVVGMKFSTIDSDNDSNIY